MKIQIKDQTNVIFGKYKSTLLNTAKNRQHLIRQNDNKNSINQTDLYFKGRANTTILEVKQKSNNANHKALTSKTPDEHYFGLKLSDFETFESNIKSGKVRNYKEAVEWMKANNQSANGVIEADILSDLKEVAIKKGKNFKPLMSEATSGNIVVYDNISSSTFEKLFPKAPNGSKLSAKQQYNGNCYFLSSINALYNNPNGRDMIIRLFEETPDGKLYVKLPNSETKYYADEVLKDVAKNEGQYSKGSLGMQMLEYAFANEIYSQVLKNGNWFDNDKNISNVYYEAAMELMALRPNIEDYSPAQYIDSGKPEDVFRCLGLEAESVIGGSDLKTAIENIENTKEKIYVLSTKDGIPMNMPYKRQGTFINNLSDIRASHAYMVERFGDNLILRNPHHPDVPTIVPLKTVIDSDYFHSLTTANLEKNIYENFRYIGIY